MKIFRQVRLISRTNVLKFLSSLQFETEAEGSRLRRDVLVSGNVAPLGASRAAKSSIESLLSGREELFAFRRAVSGP